MTELQVESGAVLLSRFQLLERLGRGAIGTVFKAHDMEHGGRLVALKLLHPHLLGDPRAVQRFRNEVLVSRTLVHPNVVRTFDLATAEDGQELIIMEYVEGTSLRDVLDENPTGLPTEEVARYVAALCSGLDAAHALGIVHRDLKPDNILIASDGAVKIADLGLARRLEDAHGLTRTGETVGTAYYMSPEQILGADATPAADLYAVGIIAFELLTGKKPFEGESYYAVIEGHLKRPIPNPRGYRRGTPRFWWPLLAALTHKNPKRRPRRALHVVSALDRRRQRTIFGKMIGAASAGPSLFWSRLVERLIWAMIIGGAVMLAAVVAVRLKPVKLWVAVKTIQAERATGLSLTPIRRLVGFELRGTPEEVPIVFQRGSVLDLDALLELGTDPDFTLPDGMPALHTALRNGSKIAMRLINAGADPNRVDPKGEVPLLVAVRAGMPHMVNALLAHGADIHATDSYGDTALHVAVLVRDLYSVNVLIARGARIDARNLDGETPLHIAVSRSDCRACDTWLREAVVTTLLNRGADRNRRNNEGKSAADLARSVGADWAIPLLENGPVSARGEPGR